MDLIRRHASLISYFSFSLATSAAGFVAAMIMIRMLPPEQFGRVALFLSFQFVGVPLISFAADSLIAIKKARLDRVDYEHFRRAYVSFAYAMFVLVQAGFLVLYAAGVLRDHIFLLVPIYGLVRFLINLASTEYVMEGKAIRFGAIGLATTLTSFALTVAFLWWFSRNADWRIVALILADIILLLVRYRGRMHLLATFRVDKSACREVIRFGLPLLLAVPPAWALNESDKILVAHFADMKSLGYYSAACAMGAVMTTFNLAMLNALTPKLYAAIGRSHAAGVTQIVRRYATTMVAALVAFGCLYAAVYWLVSDIILPEKYAAARRLVFLILLFAPCRGLYSVLGLVTDYYGMTMAKLKGVVVGGMTAVGLATAGLVTFGVAGAAVGVGGGYLVLSVVLWVYLSRHLAAGGGSSDRALA